MTRPPRTQHGRQKAQAAGKKPAARHPLSQYRGRADQLLKNRESTAETERLLAQGLKEYPGHPAMEWRMAVIAHRTGRHAAAKKRLLRTLRSKQTDYEAMFFVVGARLGESTGDRKFRIGMVREGVKRFPIHPELRFMAGELYAEDQDFRKALPHYEAAVNLNPFRVSGRRGLAKALERTGDTERAERVLLNLVDKVDGAARCDILLDIGNLQRLQGKQDAAESSYRRALEIEQRAGIYSNLGALLRTRYRFGEARAAYRESLIREPDSAVAWCNLGNLERDAGDLERALAAYDQSIRIQPDRTAFRGQRGRALLSAGRLEEGFRDFEAHLATVRSPGHGRTARLPRWDGSPLDGRSVLVTAEQDPAAQLLLARFIPRIAQQNGSVSVECHPQLARLFGHFADRVQIVERSGEPRGHALHLPMFGAPLVCGVRTPEDIPTSPWLRPPAGWTFEVPELDRPDDRLTVGVVWDAAAGARQPIAPADFLPALASAGVRTFSLQEAGADLDRMAPDTVRLGERFADLCDAASVMQRLDLVIAVDSPAAHLAGALGLPFWVLLDHAPNWTWANHGGDSPWYPTARLFRQREPGDWSGVIREVCAALRQRREAG